MYNPPKFLTVDVLAEILARGAAPEAALAEYEQVRLEPTARIVRTNREHPPDFIIMKVEALTGVDGSAQVTGYSGYILKFLQTGRVPNYAMAITQLEWLESNHTPVALGVNWITPPLRLMKPLAPARV